MKKTLIFCFLVFSFLHSTSQITSTIKGQIVDKQSQFELPGVNVALFSVDPVLGTSSDGNGYFKLENVPVGRHTVQFSFIGYKTITLENIEVLSGKETILNVEIEEMITKMQEVVIEGNADKDKPLNEMASVSARTFSIEESQRFAGARNDVARMATNFAGVSAPNDAVNDIVIRGNSPNGLLWRLDGVDVPNPNHFGRGGATGGPVSIINNNVLSNSDFFTGAFPSEYGNALSGAFDLKMRQGNSEEHEFLGQIGFNGLEFGAEGPISKKNRSSYLINYRYSTLAVFDALGLDIGTGAAVPQYQDLNFKFNFPTQKAGTFSLFGIAGMSHIDFIKSDKDTNEVDEDFYTNRDEDIYYKSRMAMVGFNHKYFWNSTTYSKITFSGSAFQNLIDVDSVVYETREPRKFYDQDFKRFRYIASFILNKKINVQHSIRLGIQADLRTFDLIDSAYVTNYDRFEVRTNFNGNGELIQPYVNWQYRITDELTLNTGMHSSIFKEEVTFEPRVGGRWQFTPRQYFSFGYGLHSQIPSIDLVELISTDQFGNISQPNKDLSFTYAHHLVVGYGRKLTENMSLKTELYYQSIFDAIVEANQESSYSLLNAGSFDFERVDSLENGGTGRNVGVEITLERFMKNGAYFLLTSSLFDSKYEGSDGIERNTVFNGNYVFNFIGGKEIRLFKNKEKKKKHFLTLDSKVTYAGGGRYTPFDVEKSIANNQNEYIEEEAYSQQLSDYFRLDLRAAFKVNGSKSTQEWALDIQNITNNQNPYSINYNVAERKEETIYQLGIFPVVQYRIRF